MTSNLRNSKLPVILFHTFTPSASGLSLASSLIQRGYLVIAVCSPDQPQAAHAATELGCIVIESERTVGNLNGFESILPDSYKNWFDGNRLRAGLEFFLREMRGAPGIVVAAIEEGYTLEDITAVANQLELHQNRIIFASRAANPKLSFGDRLKKTWARRFFAAINGRKVQDPWAGLRAIPAALVSTLLELKGTGHAFAFNIALNLHHKGIHSENVPVSAVYQPGDEAERRARGGDVLRILLLPLKFVSSSLIGMGTDYCIRFMIYGVILPGNDPVSVAVGRFSGALMQYVLNRNVVFRQKNDKVGREIITLLKFAALATFNAFAAILIIRFFMYVCGISFYIASPLADAVLYAPNYLIQRDVVFRRKAPSVS